MRGSPTLVCLPFRVDASRLQLDLGFCQQKIDGVEVNIEGIYKRKAAKWKFIRGFISGKLQRTKM